MKKNPRCPICGGCGVPLGALGNLMWFRCECCGMQFCRTVKARKPRVKKGVETSLTSDAS